MGLFDNLKYRQQIKREITDAEHIKNNILTAWSGLLDEYNKGDQISSNSAFMIRERNGQLYNIGIVRVKPSTNNQNNNYEFLFVYQDTDGQLTSQYYDMSIMGDFNRNDRALGVLSIQYLSYINSKYIPCTATIRTSTQELANIENLSITPTITPAISTYTPNECTPDANEIYEILNEFTIRESINTANHLESSADFTPGR